jgi:hypothetical protein
MKLFNRGSNNLPTDISLGGLPLYNDDLVQLESNAYQFGIPSILRGWSVILSGCLVDDLNISTKKLSLTEGYVMINDIVYYIPALTNQSYPFSIIPGSTTIDSRPFQDGTLRDVSVSYNYALKTSFTFNANENYPTNLGVNEIYFDPFSAQRYEWVTGNMGKSAGEQQITTKTLTSITETQTGKLIVGGALSVIATYGSQLKWKYLGWSPITLGKYLKNIPITSAITSGGRASFTLGKPNIPTHTHTFTGGATDSKLGTVYTPQKTGDVDRGSGSSTFSLDSQDSYNLSHSHSVTGVIGDGSADGLGASPIAVNLDPVYQGVYNLSWKGWNQMSISRQAGYKFWNASYPPAFNNM